MKVVALVSGGKDSCYAMMKCVQYGHQIVALANLMPADDSIDELDSYMYQTVGHQIIVSYAECMGLPLFRRQIRGTTRHEKLNYRTTPGDEVEDMFILLREVKRQIPSITAVSSGAIASDYQRLRVESVCSRLGLVSLAYLWKQDQSLLLREMIANGIAAITVKVAAMGLNPEKHLCKEIASLESYLHKLKELYGINVCGEGGEYETLTLDCSLFVNARIVLDEFQIVLHSPDSIAPVGVVHPLSYHLENKKNYDSVDGNNKMKELCLEKGGLLFEVKGDYSENVDSSCLLNSGVANLVEVEKHGFHISKTRSDTFSLSCWLQTPGDGGADLQEDLKLVLQLIESKLTGYGFGWEHVLYIHLYIADMNEFSAANEMYVRFITQEKCTFGVPSRSTIELPLLEAGLGKAYVEVLVANDLSKNVLHVQSISSWAPSCIGPYSQATLHKGILHMAGQLGLDPPTMSLCSGGPNAELEQALLNSEAIAKCFKSSISTSAILFAIFCSKRIPSFERLEITEKLKSFLQHLRQHDGGAHKGKVLDPIFLYILAPDLPKRAFVEIKPVLFVVEEEETESITPPNQFSAEVLDCWGFGQEDWHESCAQKCVITGKICTAVVSITNELFPKVCSEFQDTDDNNRYHKKADLVDRVCRFGIYVLDKVLVENSFSWEDTMNLRLYCSTSLDMTVETLSVIFTNAFIELAKAGRSIQIGTDSLFNIIPVLGAGKSAASMDDLITCELFARKS